MRYSTRVATYIVALAMAGAGLAPGAFAQEKKSPQARKDEVKAACSAAGGELLTASETGSYGCVTKDSVVLCTKAGNCTSYTPARSRIDIAKLEKFLKITKDETKCCTGPSMSDKCVDQPKSGGCPADHPVLVTEP